VHNLILVSKRTHREFSGLYLKSDFQYDYETTAALKKFLGKFLEPKPDTTEIKLAIVFKYSTEDLLPIFRVVAEHGRDKHKICFRCKEWDSATQKNINEAFKQKDLWQNPTSTVQSIECRQNTKYVQRYWRSNMSPQDRETWDELGFAVK